MDVLIENLGECSVEKSFFISKFAEKNLSNEQKIESSLSVSFAHTDTKLQSPKSESNSIPLPSLREIFSSSKSFFLFGSL